MTSLEFLGGIVGPWALGRQVQNSVHGLFGFHTVRGWSHQLGNEFGFTASWERKWRFNHALGNGYSWEIIPDVGITAGNVFTRGRAVAWNIFLDGNTFQNSRSVVKEPVVADLIIGAELFSMWVGNERCYRFEPFMFSVRYK